MPIYTFKCPNPKCGKVEEKIVKAGSRVLCDCQALGYDADGVEKLVHPYMELVLSTPSAPQWNCKTSHSRSKGF